MKKKIFKIAAVVMTAVAICTVFSISIISHSQGDDPLVTLSYLTEIILPQMKQDIMAEVEKNGITIESDVVTYLPEAEAETEIETGTEVETKTEGESETKEESEDKPIATASYTLLELTEGQCVYADSVVEMIVRSGSDVRAISPFDSQGIADITSGMEYLDGDMLNINSYCIIPRGGDGRGIKVFNEKSYILVRGEYHIG